MGFNGLRIGPNWLTFFSKSPDFCLVHVSFTSRLLESVYMLPTNLHQRLMTKTRTPLTTNNSSFKKTTPPNKAVGCVLSPPAAPTPSSIEKAIGRCGLLAVDAVAALQVPCGGKPLRSPGSIRERRSPSPLSWGESKDGTLYWRRTMVHKRCCWLFVKGNQFLWYPIQGCWIFCESVHELT